MDKKIDYSRPFRVPVKVEKCADGIVLKAEGEQVLFRGDVFCATAAQPLTQALTIREETIEVTCTSQQECVLEEYFYFDGVWENADEIIIAETKFVGICGFLRKGNVSFFLSLDFPYSRICHEGNRLTIGCDPKDTITPDVPYHPHTLTIGAARLTGVQVGDYDRGEIEAFSEYILSRMPENFRGERPIYSTTCITNRMTDVRDGRIFYSMDDNPTLTLDPETLKEEVRLCAELGIEYYQLFEGYFDWEEDGSSERALQEIVALGKELGVRVGDYMTALELNCWHYNYHDRKPNPAWCALEENGRRRHQLCYGDPQVAEYLKNTVVESIRRNGEEMICLDGDPAVLCFDEAHGHNPGSMYAHVRGLTSVMAAMNETSPYFMTWSNAGNWLELMPKLLWYNQNVYLSDPHPREYSPALSILKYYGDCRREQMVTVHDKYFVPYCVFTNCEYYAFQHSRVGDLAFYEYSFLQGLAVTPNICLGELRTFLERMPAGKVPQIKAFMKKWLGFVRENIDCWKNVYRLGDAPATGANEAYAHMNGERGFLCLVNQNQSQQSFTFTLDHSIGLSGAVGKRYLLTQVYPEEFPIAEQPLPGPLYADSITLTVPAFGVRIIKIEPYYDVPEGIRFYGVPAKLRRDQNQVTFEISADSGLEIPVALWLEPGMTLQNPQVQTAPTVPKYWFPSSLSSVSIAGNSSRFLLQMPRDRFDPELAQWHVDGSEKTYRLHQNNSDFCGGYIHNLCQQKFTVYLHGELSRTNEAAPTVPFEPICVREEAPALRQAAVYETILDIPFIEWPAMSREYGRDEVVELVFMDNRMVKNVRAFLDGRSVPVYAYRYPPDPSMSSFYFPLTFEVSSGTKTQLRVEVEWEADVKPRTSFKPIDLSEGDTGYVMGR